MLLRFGTAALAAVFFAGAAAAQDTPPQKPAQDTEKPQQLARPNGNSAVDTNQSGAPGNAGNAGQNASAKLQPPGQLATPPADWTQPLRIYDGSFEVRPDGHESHDSPREVYRNSCQVSGKRFLECERVQNNETIALRIFVPGDDPGHYYTQDVLPSGTALGRGDLTIDGGRWVFTTQTTRDNGAMDYQRLTLTWSGKDNDTARYLGERSDDGQHWMTIFSGTEKRQR